MIIWVGVASLEKTSKEFFPVAKKKKKNTKNHFHVTCTQEKVGKKEDKANNIPVAWKVVLPLTAAG